MACMGKANRFLQEEKFLVEWKARKFMIILVYTDISGHLQYYATPPKKTFFSRFTSRLSFGCRNHPKEGINGHCHFSEISAVRQEKP